MSSGSSSFSAEHATVIEARPRTLPDELREVWAYRELLAELASRDIRVRYKQTVLGVGWAVLRPLLAMGLFTLVFGKAANMPSEGAPYSLFVLAGLLPWTFFSTAVTAGAESLVGGQALLSKIYFPRLVLPIVGLGTAFVDLAVTLVLLAATAFLTGYGPNLSWLLLPVLLVLLVLAALGPATLLGALAVEFRDIRHIVPFLLQIWMYATPVVFPASIFPERFRWVLYLNPLAGVVEAFRAVVLGRPVDGLGLATSLAASTALLAIALVHFARVERRFADII